MPTTTIRTAEGRDIAEIPMTLDTERINAQPSMMQSSRAIEMVSEDLRLIEPTIVLRR